MRRRSRKSEEGQSNSDGTVTERNGHKRERKTVRERDTERGKRVKAREKPHTSDPLTGSRFGRAATMLQGTLRPHASRCEAQLVRQLQRTLRSWDLPGMHWWKALIVPAREERRDPPDKWRLGAQHLLVYCCRYAAVPAAAEFCKWAIVPRRGQKRMSVGSLSRKCQWLPGTTNCMRLCGRRR